MRKGKDAGWTRRTVFQLAGALFILPTAVFAENADNEEHPPTSQEILNIDDYARATEAAREAEAMLLVSIEPEGQNRDQDLVGSYLQRPDVQARFASSQNAWVFCRLSVESTAAINGEQIRLVDHPSLVELRRGPGVFLVDYTHRDSTDGLPQLYGRIVSMLPRKPGKYYRFKTSHIDALADLPAGTLTQRSMILAVRIHPERPLSTTGVADPVLASEAASHSRHQASIGNQGHHNWSSRSSRILSTVSRPVNTSSEVVAESWENQDLLDSCVDCVNSWRQSSGHWNAVRSRHKIFGYDIRRGRNGIWYATGIFAR
jgi:hypothetical protein